jgi:site-specific recombinase XerC
LPIGATQRLLGLIQNLLGHADVPDAMVHLHFLYVARIYFG